MEELTDMACHEVMSSWPWCCSRFWIMTKASIGSSDLNNMKICVCLTLRNLSQNGVQHGTRYADPRVSSTRIAPPCDWFLSQPSNMYNIGVQSDDGILCSSLSTLFEEVSESYPMPHQNPASSSFNTTVMANPPRFHVTKPPKNVAVLFFFPVRRHCTCVTDSARQEVLLNKSVKLSEWFPKKSAHCTSC